MGLTCTPARCEFEARAGSRDCGRAPSASVSSVKLPVPISSSAWAVCWQFGVARQRGHESEMDRVEDRSKVMPRLVCALGARGRATASHHGLPERAPASLQCQPRHRACSVRPAKFAPARTARRNSLTSAEFDADRNPAPASSRTASSRCGNGVSGSNEVDHIRARLAHRAHARIASTLSSDASTIGECERRAATDPARGRLSAEIAAILRLSGAVERHAEPAARIETAAASARAYALHSMRATAPDDCWVII